MSVHVYEKRKVELSTMKSVGGEGVVCFFLLLTAEQLQFGSLLKKNSQVTFTQYYTHLLNQIIKTSRENHDDDLRTSG